MLPPYAPVIGHDIFCLAEVPVKSSRHYNQALVIQMINFFKSRGEPLRNSATVSAVVVNISSDSWVV